jgi:hypothetical protein
VKLIDLWPLQGQYSGIATSLLNIEFLIAIDIGLYSYGLYIFALVVNSWEHMTHVHRIVVGSLEN